MSDVQSPHLVCVIEDQLLNRMAPVDMLEEACFQTIQAATADNGLALMRDRWREVRVLVTDIQTPVVLNGVDLAEEVHRCWPDVLLLVTSGAVTMRNEAFRMTVGSFRSHISRRP